MNLIGDEFCRIAALPEEDRAYELQAFVHRLITNGATEAEMSELERYIHALDTILRKLAHPN